MATERSYLFVPGDRPERFAKAIASGADRVILDLEDAVLPDAKAKAREAIAAWLSSAAGTPVFVRVNAVATPWHDEDVSVLAGSPKVLGFMLPKADVDSFRSIRDRMKLLKPLVALVETAHGMANLRRLASAGGVQRFAFGSVDFCTEVGIRGDVEELDFFRSQLVFESFLGGLAPPLDGVTVDVLNEDALRADVERARRFGFGGKLCIHPRQVSPTNAGFSPSAAEIAWARKVVDACRSGRGAVVVDGKLVDRPVRLNAERILAEISADDGRGRSMDRP